MYTALRERSDNVRYRLDSVTANGKDGAAASCAVRKGRAFRRSRGQATVAIDIAHRPNGTTSRPDTADRSLRDEMCSMRRGLFTLWPQCLHLYTCLPRCRHYKNTALRRLALRQVLSPGWWKPPRKFSIGRFARFLFVHCMSANEE